MSTSVKVTNRTPTTDRLAALRLQLVATEMSLRVGQRIRQRREELGIRTQRELADLIPSPSVTNQTVNKWEKGANEPSARYKAMLAEALQVDVAYFIAEDPKLATPDPFPPAEDHRIASLEARLTEQAEVIMALLDQQNALLARQSKILERIEEAVGRENEAAKQLAENGEAWADRLLSRYEEHRAELQSPALKRSARAK